MLKFRTEAEFQKWLGALPPAQSRRIGGRATVRPVPSTVPPGSAAPARARTAGRPGLRARAERAATWFFVGVVGLSTWGLSLCVFGLAVRMYP